MLRANTVITGKEKICTEGEARDRGESSWLATDELL